MRIACFAFAAFLLWTPSLCFANTIVADEFEIKIASPRVSADLIYNVVFDPSVSYSSELTGIEVISASFSGEYVGGFLVSPAFSYDSGDGLLTFGGAAALTKGYLDGTGASSYLLSVAHAESATPTFGILQIQASGVGFYYTGRQDGYGSVTLLSSIPSADSTTPTLPSSVTPEPSSIALFGTGLLGLCAVARRRKA